MVTSKETNDQLAKVECVGGGWMSVPYTVNTVPREKDRIHIPEVPQVLLQNGM